MGIILVTGGLGFVGSHTSLALIEKGFKILIVDSNINSSKETFNRIKAILIQKKIAINDRLNFIKGDLRNLNFIEKLFSKHNSNYQKIDFVIHFAGLKSIQKSFLDPLAYWDNNLSGTINLLKTMKKYDCKNLIFSSSATIYDSTNEQPQKEIDSIKPINPYGQTKYTIEKILNDIYNSDKSWKIANLRYFNPVGAHDSGLLGEGFYGMSSNLIPKINRVVFGEDEVLEIYGNDWDTPDGTCIRDFVHVMDVAEAHCLVLNYLIDGIPKILNLNVGTGKGYSVLELIKTYEEINKVKIKYEFHNRRVGDYPISIADNKYIQSVLGWKPKRNLKKMCKDSWNYYFSRNKE